MNRCSEGGDSRASPAACRLRAARPASARCRNADRRRRRKQVHLRLAVRLVPRQRTAKAGPEPTSAASCCTRQGSRSRSTHQTERHPGHGNAIVPEGSPSAARVRRRRTCSRFASRRVRCRATRNAAPRSIVERLRSVPRRAAAAATRTGAHRHRHAARGVYLRDAMVKPEATHPPRYLVVGAMNNGERSGDRGIRFNEDVFWIEIRDAGGTVHVLQKSEHARNRSRARGDADAVVRIAAVGRAAR